MRGVSSWWGAIRVQRTASSPVAPDTAQPGSRAPAGGYSVVCPDGAHGSVAAAPGPEFLGCRACLLPQNSWPGLCLPLAPFSRVVTKKQSPLAWRVGSQWLLFEAMPASGRLVPVHVLPRSSARWPLRPPAFLRVTTQGHQLCHQACQEPGQWGDVLRRGRHEYTWPHQAQSCPQDSGGRWAGGPVSTATASSVRTDWMGWGPHVAPHRASAIDTLHHPASTSLIA